MRSIGTCLVAVFLAISAPSVRAECPGPAAVDAYVKEFAAGTVSKGFGKQITASEAECALSRLIPALESVQGPRVGYKALFTNPDAQKRFGVSGPAWGAMHARMMLSSGASVPAAFGAKPRYEADFVVVVKDPGLAEARTPEEALGHISHLVPFIELPDLMLDGSPTGPELIATNAAFRGGILGGAIAVEGRPELVQALADMEVTITEEVSGKELGREKGAVLMGHPLNAAIWLAKAVKAAGHSLKPGDLLSLGGFKGSAATAPGTRISVRYLGLPGDPAVTVSFKGAP